MKMGLGLKMTLTDVDRFSAPRSRGMRETDAGLIYVVRLCFGELIIMLQADRF